MKQQTLDAAAPLVQNAIDTNLIVCPLPNTPLAILNEGAIDSSLFATFVRDPSGAVITTEPAAFAFHIRSYAESNELYQADRNELIATVGEAVKAEIYRARNVVNPIINSAVQHIHDCFEKYVNRAAINIAIVRNNESNIWKYGTIDTLISQYKNLPYRGTNTPNCYTSTPENLLEFIKTGSQRFDEEITEWALSQGDGFLEKVWNKVFAAGPTGELGAVISNGDEGLAAFLIASKLSRDDSLLGSVTGLSLDQLRVALADTVSQSAGYIQTELDNIARSVKRGKLIVKMPNPSDVRSISRGNVDIQNVIVNGDMFDEFLAAGGTPDIIFGSVISDRQTEYQALLTDAKKYTQKWGSYIGIISEANESRKFGTFKSALTRALIDEINGSEVGGKDEMGKEEVRRRVVDAIDALPYSSLDNIYNSVLDVVCLAIFQDPNVKYILDTINKVTATNKDLDMRHVATLAVVDHVVNWCISQLQAKRGK